VRAKTKLLFETQKNSLGGSIRKEGSPRSVKTGTTGTKGSNADRWGRFHLEMGGGGTVTRKILNGSQAAT